MRYRQVRVIGGRGPGPEQFAEALRGICVDGRDLLYVVGDREVKVFDEVGKLRQRWATARPGYCVAVDRDLAVYVGQEGHIEKFDSAGRLLTTWRDADRLGLVTAIAFFGEDILIADARHRCIRRLDHHGQWLNDIGKSNNTRGFLIPNGHLDLAVDARGIIHAAHSGKHRVERYSLAGELLGHFGRFGTERPEDFPGCCNPTNLTLSPQGHVIVTEKAGPRLKVYEPDGRLQAVVGPEVFDPNCKNMDVAVDSRGRIYVVDTVRLHVVVFAADADTPGPTTQAPKTTGA